MITKTISHYKSLKYDRNFYVQCSIGVIFLIGATLIDVLANSYTTRHVGMSVSDLILDHIPVLNLDDVFLEGAFMFTGFVLLIMFYRPRGIPFITKTIALFFIIRSFFLILTHLAPPAHEIHIYTSDIVRRLASGDDLFFSGHTGFPFLMALMFWHDKWLRYAFLVACLIFASAVLFAHLHYSIDVFSAFFITYGIYHIALWAFKSDHEYFKKEV